MIARRCMVSMLGLLIVGAALPQIEPRPPGESVYCALAIQAALDEIGRQCFPGEDAELKSAIADNITRLERYVLANSKATPAYLRRFKDQMAERDSPAGAICKGDGPMMYREIRKAGASEMRKSIDTLTSRPGEPTWGTCL